MDEGIKIALIIAVIIFIIIPLLWMLVIGAGVFDIAKHVEDAGCCCGSPGNFYLSNYPKDCRPGYKYTSEACSSAACKTA